MKLELPVPKKIPSSCLDLVLPDSTTCSFPNQGHGDMLARAKYQAWPIFAGTRLGLIDLWPAS